MRSFRSFFSFGAFPFLPPGLGAEIGWWFPSGLGAACCAGACAGDVRRPCGAFPSGIRAAGRTAAPEDAGAGAGHARIAIGREPCKILGNDREARDGHRLQVVRPEPRPPVGGVHRRCIALELRDAEDRRGGNLHRRFQHDVPGRRQIKWLQRLADAFGKGVLPEDEHRHIGAQRQPDFLQTLAR